MDNHELTFLASSVHAPLITFIVRVHPIFMMHLCFLSFVCTHSTHAHTHTYTHTHTHTHTRTHTHTHSRAHTHTYIRTRTHLQVVSNPASCRAAYMNFSRMIFYAYKLIHIFFISALFTWTVCCVYFLLLSCGGVCASKYMKRTSPTPYCGLIIYRLGLRAPRGVIARAKKLLRNQTEENTKTQV